ncbi:MAG: M23 family metallopeptidase [Planctomycetes bacterium]|nr:M23 family metallopeptidase [Planctomycetota bacterium]
MIRKAGLLLLLLGGDDLAGPLEYLRDGVKLEGKVSPWKKIASIEEGDPVGAVGDPFGDAEGKALVRKIVENAWDKEAIQAIGPRIAGRAPKTALSPAWEGRWQAVEDKTRHHQLKAFALHALDLMKVDAEGRVHQGGGKELTDFYGWGALIRAPADGDVIQVDDGFEDLPAGKGGKFAEANFVTLRHAGGECSTFGHLKKGSAKVKLGEAVKKGQPLAQVGNSGASNFPHCHFTLMIPVQDDQGRGGWVSVPWRLQGFRLVGVGKTACDIEVRQARPQEGWTMLFP